MPKVLGYELGNHHKYERAVNGNERESINGVGEDADQALILAAYDRLGGLIMKGKDKVQNGCFCDLEESKKKGKVIVIEDPFIVFEHRDHEGNLHLVDEDEEEPEAIKMAKLVKKEKSAEYREERENEAKELGVKFTKSDKTSAIVAKIRTKKKEVKKEEAKAKKEADKKEAREKKEAEKKAKEEAKKEE